MIVRPRYRGPEFTVFHPSFVLEFARDKALDSRVTFTRASSGTYWDENSVLQTATTDEPRFTHNPVTGESLGLLVEGAATNLLTYSEDFSNAVWAKAGNGTGSAAAVTPNDAIAPDGELTADLIVLDRGAGNTLSDYSAISQNSFSLTNGVTYSGGLFIKAATVGDVGKEIAIRYAEGAYDVHTLTTTWQRVSGAETSTPSYAGGFEIASRGSITADNTVSFHAWGAQLETGSRASSYIKTEASTVTRAADLPVMTGTNFSSWYNASEGTFVLDAVGYASGQSIVLAQNAAVTNYIELAWRTSGLTLPLAYIVDGGVNQASLSGLSAGSNKTALAYRNNDFALSANGGAPTTDSSGTVPSVDRLVFYANSTIKLLTYYPRRLPDAQLQVITA